MSKYPKKAKKAVPVLKVVTPLSALVSIVTVSISLSTGYWLDAFERVPIESASASGNEEFIIKRTLAGIWKICVFNITQHQMLIHQSYVSQELMNCKAIDYFKKYVPDPEDSDTCISYTVTKAGPLFIIAAGLLIVGILGTFIGHGNRRCRIVLFSAGITFIISGLMTLIGLVVYISVLQSEVGPKLRSKNSVDQPPLEYKYGYSFVLVVAGFMCTEMTGILAIFFYIYWHQLDWFLKTNRLVNYNSKEKLSKLNKQLSLRQDDQFPYDTALSSYYKYGECDRRSHSSKSSGLRPSSRIYRIGDELSNNAFKSNRNNQESSTSEDDFEIPLPPPPPSIPRDLTALSDCSPGTYFDNGRSNSKCLSMKILEERITPV